MLEISRKHVSSFMPEYFLTFLEEKHHRSLLKTITLILSDYFTRHWLQKPWQCFNAFQIGWITWQKTMWNPEKNQTSRGTYQVWGRCWFYGRWWAREGTDGVSPWGSVRDTSSPGCPGRSQACRYRQRSRRVPGWPSLECPSGSPSPTGRSWTRPPSYHDPMKTLRFNEWPMTARSSSEQHNTRNSDLRHLPRTWWCQLAP